MFHTSIDGSAVSFVFLMDRLYDRRIFFLIAVCNRCGSILRTVIHNQNFHFLSADQQRIDTLLHICFRIIAWYCN